MGIFIQRRVEALPFALVLKETFVLVTMLKSCKTQFTKLRQRRTRESDSITTRIISEVVICEIVMADSSSAVIEL